MKKRLGALLLTAALCVGLAGTAFADTLSPEQERLQVLSVLGVMNGNEKGDLMLDAPVSRAAFVKMTVAASAYKDGAVANAHVSPFGDVKSSHWASGYVKTAVDAGWITGYTDGSFRPDATIRLEEAVNVVLKMLGYTQNDFTGNFPEPQMALYKSLDLDENLKAVRGQELSRLDCAELIYNALNATNRTGMVHAQTLGYALDGSGKIHYLSLLNSRMEGPLVADADWQSDLNFVPRKVYRNGELTTTAGIQKNDVLYHIADAATVWAYSDKVTGIYEAVSPNKTNPTAVTVSGRAYTVGTSAAAYALSSMGSFAVGDQVTLLLGRDGSVAAVVAPEATNELVFGVVTATGTKAYTDDKGLAYTADYIQVTATDGNSYQYATKAKNFDTGDLVQVRFGKDLQISRLSGSSAVTGTVSADGRSIGGTALAEGAQILDVYEAAAVKVNPSRLAGVRLDSSDVRYCQKDEQGRIKVLILNNVTGDMFFFGVLAEVITVPTGSFGGTTTYSYLSNGMPGVLSGSSTYSGQKNDAIRIYSENGAAQKLFALQSMKLDGAADGKAWAGSRTYSLAGGLQVYLKEGSGEYQLSNLDRVNGGDHNLTGWYDAPESDGGRIRVIIAVEK